MQLNTPSRQVRALMLACLFGLIGAVLFGVLVPWWLIIAPILAGILVTKFRTIFFCALATVLMLGLWRGGQSLKIPTLDLGYFEKVTEYLGIVRSVQTDFQSQRVVVELRSALREPVHGLVRVRAPLFPEIEPGSLVQFSCRVRASSQEWTWLLRDLSEGVTGSCSVDDLRVSGSPSTLDAWRISAQRTLASAMREVIREPFGAVIRGMLYGDDGEIPFQIKTDMRRAGLSHLLAVSGSNVSLFVLGLMNLLIFFILSRIQAAYAATLALVLFTIFVGFDPPIVRAAIMAGVAILGIFIGRPGSTLNALLLAATIMLFLDPRLIFSASFMLSFMATLAISVVAPKIAEKLDWLPDALHLRGNFAAALAIVALTGPVTALYFGSMNPIAPLTNILALELVFPILALGILVLVLSVILPIAASLLAVFLEGGVFLLLIIARAFGSLPSASIELPLWAGLTMSLMVTVLILRFAYAPSLKETTH